MSAVELNVPLTESGRRWPVPSRNLARLIPRLTSLIRPRPKIPPDDWARQNRRYPETAGQPGPREPSLTPYVIPIERAVWSGQYKRVVATCSAQVGKALALDTPLPTPTGWTTIGEVKEGDSLFDEDGDQCIVTVVKPIFYNRPCYEIEFCDGSIITADGGHLWTVTTNRWRRRASDETTVETLTTEELLARGIKLSNGAARFAIPVAGKLDLPDAELPVPPYFLGAWLGDGNSRAARITAGDEDVDTMAGLLRNEGFYVTCKRYLTAWDIAVRAIDERGKPYSLRSPMNLQGRLRSMGVLGNKHIPDQYLRSSVSQRLALLQGLMDTDGGVSDGTSSFCSKFEHLARQVADLIATLGYRPSVYSRQHPNGKLYWYVRFYAYRESAVFRFERKIRAMPSRHHVKSRPYLNDQRYIRDIRAIPSVPVRCIGVDSPSHLFLAGERMIPTHNTDLFLDLIGARLDQRPAPILYVGPTRDFVVDQFEPRLMALLDDAPSLRSKVIRGRRMKKARKIVAGVPVRLAHGGSSAALKSDPAALALIDEYDEMLANIKGQGDPLGLVEARGFTYADFVTAVVSTPSQGIVDTEVDLESGLEFWRLADPDDLSSGIWKLFQGGTRHHWAWPCPECGEFFIPRFKCLQYPKGATPAEACRDSWLVCPHHGCIITDDKKPMMNARGVYVAPGQRVDADGVVTGDIPENSVCSFWVSGLASPFVTWGERAQAYLDALRTGEDDKVQTAINTGFGECYALGGGGDVPDWEAVRSRSLPYKSGEVPREILKLVAGVDVQKRSLIYGVRGFGGRSTSFGVQYGQILGDTSQDDVWDELRTLLLTPIAGMPIERCFIDSGFRPGKPESGDEHKVYEFARSLPRLVFATKGHATQTTPIVPRKIEVKPNGSKPPYALTLIHLDTDFFKSLVHSRLRTEIGKPGAFYVSSDVTEDYCRQLVSEARVVSRANGRPVWIVRNRQNHFLDVEAMIAAVGYMLRVQLLPEGALRDWALPPEDEPKPPPEGGTPSGGGDEPPPTPPPPPAPPNSIRDRFARHANRMNR